MATGMRRRREVCVADLEATVDVLCRALVVAVAKDSGDDGSVGR